MSEKKREDSASEAGVVLKLLGVGVMLSFSPDGHLDETQEAEQGHCWEGDWLYCKVMVEVVDMGSA